MKDQLSNPLSTCFATGLVIALFSGAAHAHVSVSSDTAFSASRYEIKLTVPHGCEDSDTYRVEVQIPASLSSVRPMDSLFGKAEPIMNDAGDAIEKIVWNKSAADVLVEDSHYYEFAIRAKLPEAEFVTLYLPTIQYCRDKSGNELQSEWVGMGSHDDHGASGDEAPAPSFMIFPKRFPGWNKYTAADHLHDMSIFSDAEIVWSGSSAYSPNPTTLEMIQGDADSVVLEQLHPGMEFWVKY
ncbi:MAG: YcnI family protein [Pseudomonadales bacterium]|uniref:YncI copper-binding domain-containing protein n=1 Tax=Oleiphilus messinensis TaxID=141451 RepID=A0A1Y0IGE9_9GAMM|nr:YcnI family protein [Oleiphilus messinensis]ARU58493.1 hypothetical protein OLMES_4497 [Oleiphilus messinensis]MCG8610848.1 YcnI family protein [Pseudomonadales bacterium]